VINASSNGNTTGFGTTAGPAKQACKDPSEEERLVKTLKRKQQETRVGTRGVGAELTTGLENQNQ
jgi:hypothetical protein